MANTCVLYIGVVMVIRRNTSFSYGSSVFVLGGLGGVLHTSKYIGVVMVIRRNISFSYGSSVFVLGGLGGVLHTGKYTKVTLLLVSVIRGQAK
jgi:uncharacterized membrane protein